MSSQLTQSLMPILALTLIASTANCIVYFLLRAIEKKSQLVSASITAIILLVQILRIYSFIQSNVSSLSLVNSFSVWIVTSAIGGLIHMKSGGNSKNFAYAFFLMFAVISASSDFNNYILQTLNLTSISLRLDYAKFVVAFTFWLLGTAQYIAPPLLVWAWKSSHLRPGMDKHLES